MLNASDSETIASLNVLRHTVANTKRPIAIWLGAGVSRWAGLPSWHELARRFIRIFSRQVSGFAVSDAKAAYLPRTIPVSSKFASGVTPLSITLFWRPGYRVRRSLGSTLRSLPSSGRLNRCFSLPRMRMTSWNKAWDLSTSCSGLTLIGM